MAKTETKKTGFPVGRLAIQKTYKLYIGGKFPRTESGRYYQIEGKNGFVANVCRSSRKDLRNAIKMARKEVDDWSTRKPFNRGHILYRMAEMLEHRSVQFVEELVLVGIPKKEAEKEVQASIDRLVYYAGWTDKVQQVFGSVNPTNTSHFNFSAYEPTGVVAILPPENPGLLGLISTIAPVIAGGNVCSIVPGKNYGTIGILLGEVCATSDLPGGVVNVLTGYYDELASHMGIHMDINAILDCNPDSAISTELQKSASTNVKRYKKWDVKNWYGENGQSPYFMLDFMEVKTTWHPIGF